MGDSDSSLSRPFYIRRVLVTAIYGMLQTAGKEKLMEQAETQLDIISRLLPSGKLSETEKYIADQLIALERDRKVYVSSLSIN